MGRYGGAVVRAGGGVVRAGGGVVVLGTGGAGLGPVGLGPGGLSQGTVRPCGDSFWRANSRESIQSRASDKVHALQSTLPLQQLFFAAS